ncbi:uncharacterized protein LOC131615890 isoform X2 [Vicia villosa]|uniref:uncharacterized protein LOC131615890 isoform X2 n=1 Tax=Vicia villosa TaxID=3911 RepID=UPI00273CE937|nr:uncharacterized protein LOC131615890 isoform X2 [Vicia villosa]
MAVPSDKDHTPKSDSINACCDQWRNKYLKAQESRNALRQAVKFLECKINEIQAYNNKVCADKIETGVKVEECYAVEKNELCSLKSRRGCDGGTLNWDENEKVLAFQACIAEKDKEICRLKELLEIEKRRADSKRKRVAETLKLLEQEKNRGAQIARIKMENAEGYRVHIGQLEKQVSEAKQKSKSEMSAFKKVIRRFDCKKRKILAEKRRAELEMAKANENLEEIEKHKAVELVKLKEQKALAEDNWNKFTAEKCRADKMSQQLEEDKRTIEDLKRKIHELSSLREHIEMASEISAEAQSSRCSEVKHLKSNPMVEKLRAKHTKQKYKLEASHYSILRHELGRLKVCFVQFLHRFDVLDASFLPVSGSIQDQTKFFVMDTFGLMVIVLKSLIMSPEGESLSDVTASCLPSTNPRHTEFCTNVSCPFLERDESIDGIANLLLEEINNCWFQGIKQVDLSDSGLMPGNGNVRQWSKGEGDQCATNKNNDVSSCLRNCSVSDTRPHALKNAILCRLSDIASLVELVANKMSWHWTDIKLVPQLLNMLDTCVEEKIVIVIIVLLGQLGRIGIDNGGYEDRGVENLRCNLFAYLCRFSSTKATLSVQIATVNILFGLLPTGLETLFLTNISPSAYSKTVSDNVETLRKWFFGLGQEDQQVLLSGILKHTNVYNKSNLSLLSHLHRFSEPMIH